MNTWHCARLAFVVVLPLGVAGGCDALLPDQRAPEPAAAPAETASEMTHAAPGAATTAPVGVAPQAPPAATPPTAGQVPAVAPPAVRPPANAAGAASAGTAPATAGAGSSVALSTGIALPQTLPEGTAIGVSVEYEFIRGAPHPSARYALVIQPAQGGEVELQVQLQASGTIQGYTYDLRPDQAPFTAFLRETTADGESRALSESIELR